MDKNFEHSALGHIAREVLEGKTRELPWSTLRVCVEADSADEKWAMLLAWGREHGISLRLEDRRQGSRTETWVLLGRLS